MFAGVYREMRKVGVKNPRDVDEMEIWEIADALGVGREDVVDSPGGQRDSRAHLRARVEAEREGRPQPTFNDGIDEEPDESYAELMAVLGSGSSLS